MLDEDRALEPPDPFPNSEVKRRIADGSVGSPHVRVGHRQALNTKNPDTRVSGFFFACEKVPAPVGGHPVADGGDSIRVATST